MICSYWIITRRRRLWVDFRRLIRLLARMEMVIDTAFPAGLANMRNIDTLRGKDEASRLFGTTAQRLAEQREVSSHNMTQTIRYLVLLLTTDCNLRCAYCYRQELSDAS
jgi:sulfatase maturation enzyme AslB (radical SAM superfamily)